MLNPLSSAGNAELRAPCTAEAWLADGTPVRIRPIQRSDLELERRLVCGLSSRTRYLRLLSGRQLLPGELERWTNIDPTREIALIAVVAEGDASRRSRRRAAPSTTGTHCAGTSPSSSATPGKARASASPCCGA